MVDLVKFLKFVGADPSESEKDFADAFVKRLQKSVKEVKESREMGARHMIFQEMLRDEYAAGKSEGKVEGILQGKAESVLEILREMGNVTDELENYIVSETDLERMKGWFKLALKVSSVEEFVSKMNL